MKGLNTEYMSYLRYVYTLINWETYGYRNLVKKIYNFFFNLFRPIPGHTYG